MAYKDTATAKYSGNRYFGFMKRGSPEFARAVLSKYDDGQMSLADHPLSGKIFRSYASYYARNPRTGEQDTTEIHTAGDDGEIVFADINEYRALLSQQRVNATASPPNWAPLASNIDTSTLSATRISRSILEHYRRSVGLEDQMQRLIEVCLVMGVGWIGAVWDPRMGEPVGVATDESIIYAGDFEFSVKTPYDVVIDPHSPDYNYPRWMVVRRKVNRYDLIARYPEHEEQIMQHAMWLPDAFSYVGSAYSIDGFSADNEDVCHVLEVYFARSDSLPEGRQALIINAETIGYDFYGTVPDEDTGEERSIGLDYRDIPYIRLAQAETLLERHPHADSHDLLLPTELLQHAVGKIATLQTAKTNLVFKPAGASWDVDQMGTFSQIEYQPGQEKPEVATFFGADDNDFRWADFCRQLGERQAVVNEAQRGISASGDSGSKAAFVASSSQTFGAGFVRRVTMIWERLGTHIIRTMATHATSERVIALAGTENMQEVMRFVGQDIAAIDRVQVHDRNPALDSPQGRTETAFKLFQMSQGNMTIEQFMQLARTGQLDLADEDYVDEQMRIAREGELIKKGRPDKVYITKWDKHSLHIKKHYKELYDIPPDTRAFTDMEAHIALHLQHLIPPMPGQTNEYFDPYALLVTGETPLPILGPDGNPVNASAGPPALPSGGPSAPGPKGPQPASGAGPARLPDHPGAGGGPPQVKMPKPPINPGTGQPAEMPPIQNTMPAQENL